jgi:hypothetical protein
MVQLGAVKPPSRIGRYRRPSSAALERIDLDQLGTVAGGTSE